MDRKRDETDRGGEVAGLLRDLAGRDGPARARLVEQVSLDLLADGDLVVLRGAVAAVPQAERTLWLRVADTEAAVRLQVGGLAELQSLTAEADATEGAQDCRAWMAAITAEHFFWRGDLLGLAVAEAALDLLPDEPLLPIRMLLARARLRRLAALGRLFSFDREGPLRARAVLDSALTDFTRGGWHEERAVTAALVSAMWAAVSWDEVRAGLRVLQEAVDLLRARRSHYLPLCLAGLALVAFLEGDMARVHDAASEAERLAAGMIPAVDVVVLHLRGMARLVGEGPGAAGVLDEIAESFRAKMPQAAGSMATTAAAALADFGAYGVAEDWAGRARHGEAITPYGGFDREAVDARLELVHRPGEASLARFRDACLALESVGLDRFAGVTRLRAARDCERIGWDEPVAEMRAEGLAAVPPPPERTLWEAIWAEPLLRRPVGVPVSGRGVRAGSGGVLRVLRPDLGVERHGAILEVPLASARLLAVLVAERQALTVDRLLECLWPEVDPEAGRTRLNTAIYRIRRQLGLGPDELVVRRTDGVALVESDGWTVDAWEFERLVAGDGDARAGALGLYGGDLCGRQLAYDDRVDAERDRLQAVWTDLAAGLVDEGAVEPAAVAEAASRLRIDDPARMAPLAGALARAGHPALAAGLVEGAAT